MVEILAFALVVISEVVGNGAHQDVGMNSMLPCSTGAAALYLPTRATLVLFTRSQSYKAFIGLYLQIDGYFLHH